MTRETKIGLLVGLAFIIVIGILLSDHMTTTTEPQKAPLSTAGANVRESMTAPSSAHAGQAPAAVATAPPVNAPAQPVLTQGDLAAAPQPAAPAQRPVQNIQVGPPPGATQAQVPVTIQQTTPAPTSVAQGPVTVPPSAEPPVTFVPPGSQAQHGGAVHPLQRIAARHGEEVVVFGDGGSGTGAGAPNSVPMAPLREYKAEAGDSLSRLASRLMGSNTKANREAIVRANPSLHGNPDKIIAGRTYVIPPPPQAPADAASPTVASSQQTPGSTASPASAAPASSPTDNFAWYTVKENDNLWKIAAEQLGTGNAWTQIRDLNQDLLRGEDRVRPNMRIRLPKQQPVASAG
jgi:nucleoid-associated protein YgaU